jgi:hypothetical protein
MREALERLSATPLPGTSQEAAARLTAESENWGAVIRGAGIRAE